MPNNTNIIISSSAFNPFSLTGLILLNPVTLLVFWYKWGVSAIRNKVKNAPQNLQMPKPEAAASTKEDCCDENELSLEELKMVMKKTGTLYDPDADKLQDRISSVEITSLFEEQEPSLQEVKDAFCTFDENNDGFIDAVELQKIISALSFMTPSESDCASMIRAYDDNGDGVVDFNEFLKLVTSSFS